jgi:hypothetical protein
MAVDVMRRCVQERLQMLVDHAVQHAALGGAGPIPDKAMDHADDVRAISGLRQCRENDTRKRWRTDDARVKPSRRTIATNAST